MERKLFVSVIIPVYNAGRYFDQCLSAINSSSYSSYEVIVVDDCSTDNSVEIARKNGATVLELSHQSGPAAARNYGAEKAKGDVFFFVDSDVVIERGTVARLAADFEKNPDVAAVFGSYDDEPAEKDFFSQYKNLYHHFVHQQSSSDAVTFWAGCGAIRRDAFHQAGGFDQDRYSQPSIEDIELGYRLRKMGHRIMLDKELQAKHLKRWGWNSWVKTDVLNRAVPWSQLILESGFLPTDLNLQTSHRVSAILVGLLVLMIPLFFVDALSLYDIAGGGFFLAAFLVLIASLVFLNQNLYKFLYRKRGAKFMVFSIPMHFLYYLYSGAAFAVCLIIHKSSSRRSGLRKAAASSQKRSA